MVTATERLAASLPETPRSEFRAAPPSPFPPESVGEAKPDVDPTPTPIAQAICPASVPPPPSTPVEIDQRIDRLLAEILSLLNERSALRALADERATRCNELLAEAQKAKRLVRAWFETQNGSDANPTVGNVEAASQALSDMAAWAAKPL